jgi:hypothetical protein
MRSWPAYRARNPIRWCWTSEAEPRE